MPRPFVAILLMLLPVTSYPALAHHFDRGDGTVEVLFLGDTSFGENYQARLERKGHENVLKAKGYDYFISNYREILGLKALVAANLETPVTNLPLSPLAGEKKYIHYADVVETPRYLSKYHVRLVNLANNHSLDFGRGGLEQTLNVLGHAGIGTCGAGLNDRQAARPYGHEIRVGGTNVRLVIVCAFTYRRKYDRVYGFYAGKDSPGVNRLSVERIQRLARKLHAADRKTFLVVFPHWGKNYRPATAKQKTTAHALIDAGVDLIVGHGGHMAQEMELYRGRWIVYGLGNFVFGSPGRYARKNVPPYSVITRLTLAFGPSGVAPTLRIYPIFSDNRKTNYRGRFVTAEEFREAVDVLLPGGAFASRVTLGEDAYGHFIEAR